ncbi:MAG: multiheme c-type cytochrome, partial [Kofleriaceae bacterium]
RPQPWCVNCHAPLTTQQRDLSGPRAAQGVDCASCHVRAGRLVSARRAQGSPHDTITEPSFGSPAFCADCHQFTFPVLEDGRAVAMTRHPMQNTVASFTAGPYAGERDGCMSCHGSRHGHAFAGAHDRGMLEGALEVAWCRSADAPRIAVSVRNAAAGHNVPTGDIHRHMYLRVWRSSAPESMFQAYFGRRFEPAPDGGKRTNWDSTIAPGASRRFSIELAALGEDDGEPLNLELVYVYIIAEFPRGAAAPTEPTTASVVRRRMTPVELPVCAP